MITSRGRSSCGDGGNVHLPLLTRPPSALPPRLARRRATLHAPATSLGITATHRASQNGYRSGDGRCGRRAADGRRYVGGVSIHSACLSSAYSPRLYYVSVRVCGQGQAGGAAVRLRPGYLRGTRRPIETSLPNRSQLAAACNVDVLRLPCCTPQISAPSRERPAALRAT